MSSADVTMMSPPSSGGATFPAGQDLVRGTRIVVQSLPAPLNGRSGKIIDYDAASQAYIVHVDGGNPRTIYRENLRILEDQSVPVVPPKRAPQTRAGAAPRAAPGGNQRLAAGGPVSDLANATSIRPGDQVLLCLEQHQFTLLEVTGIRRVCRQDPCSFAIAAAIDDADVPQWMRKPPPAASKSGTKPAGFRIGDPVYAVWDQDGRWYPGRVREDAGGDRFEIEWLDKEAVPSIVKKSLVCKRTTYDDLRNRPSYLAALNLASRTPGMRGLKANMTNNAMDEDDGGLLQQVRDEEAKRRAAAAAAQLFDNNGKENNDVTQDEWNTVIKAMRVLERFGVDGLVNSGRGQVFHVPPPLTVHQPAGGVSGGNGLGMSWNQTSTANSLHAWITEGQTVKSSLTLPPAASKDGSWLVAPSRAALEGSLRRAWPGKQGLSLPKGPLDIFHPHQPAAAENSHNA